MNTGLAAAPRSSFSTAARARAPSVWGMNGHDRIPPATGRSSLANEVTENESISPAEVKQAFGQGEIDQLALDAGVQPDEFADKVSRELPGAIDKATPQGVIPSAQKAASGAFDR